MKAKQEITIREKAAIELYIRGIITRKPELYKIAYSDSLEQVENLAHLPSSATRWFASEKMQVALREAEAIYKDQARRERERIEAEIMAIVQRDKSTEGDQRDGMVDYSKPANQLRKLNELIHSAPDQKDELDALKVLIAQTSREPQERSPEGRQVHAYLPLSCYDCPLYLNAKSSRQKVDIKNVKN